MTRSFVLTTFSLLLFGTIPDRAGAAELYVAPDGNDANPGTQDQPWATLERAQQAARAAKLDGGVTVQLRGGTYYLGRPLVFTPADSGTAQGPLVFAAEPGQTVVISGGVRLKLDWKPFRDGILQAATPAELSIDQLFLDGRRLPMARYPNFDPQVRIYNGYAADAFSPQRAARWADPRGGYIHAMHRAHWGGYHYRITGKLSDGSVAYEGGWQNNRQMGMHGEHRFVENIFEELDAPGEWFHDARTNSLYLFPPAAPDDAAVADVSSDATAPDAAVRRLNAATIEVVQLRHLVEFRGTPAEPVRHVHLRGLTFRHAARTFLDTKEPLLRSDWTIYRGGAVLYDGAEDCELTDACFDQLGGNAVFVNNYNRRLTIRRCLISDSGASGVAFVGDPQTVRNPLFEYGQRHGLSEIDQTPGPRGENYPADCLVEDCLIRRVGRVEKQVAGVQISMAKGITVRHCSIYETPRAGINISEGTFGGHLIEFCDVFDTVLETGDHGSFNSWGRDRFWGLVDAPAEDLPRLALLDVVEPNILRNSRWRCDHGWDIDLDDGSSHYQVTNNLLLGGGLKFREGFHRVAENNVMVNNSFHPHVWYPNSQDIVRRNIVFAPYRPIRVPQPWGQEVDRNLWHQPDVPEPRPATQLQEQSGRDEHSIVADARFLDPAAGDYRVADDSPARALGFENFPMDRFGVQKPELKALARAPQLPGREALDSSPSPGAVKIVHYWLGAVVRELEGEEYSALGVSKDAGGVLLAEVPAGSPAAACRLKANDFVQSINDQPVKRLADLHRLQNVAAGPPLNVSLVRAQQPATCRVERYPFFETETSPIGEFSGIALGSEATVPIRAASTRPDTANEPVATLYDGRLADNYGPVFRNGVLAGAYRIDLGQAVDVAAASTWSCNQNGNRGSQHFQLFGSDAAADPGWEYGPGKKFAPIAEVNTAGLAVQRYQATRVRGLPGQSLGRFRWLLWIVYPVTAAQENTAYQEFQVTAAP